MANQKRVRLSSLVAVVVMAVAVDELTILKNEKRIGYAWCVSSDVSSSADESVQDLLLLVMSENKENKGDGLIVETKDGR